jgi:hypothetical protein
VLCAKLLSRHSSGTTEENHEKLQSVYLAPLPEWELSTSRSEVGKRYRLRQFVWSYAWKFWVIPWKVFFSSRNIFWNSNQVQPGKKKTNKGSLTEMVYWYFHLFPSGVFRFLPSFSFSLSLLLHFIYISLVIFVSVFICFLQVSLIVTLTIYPLNMCDI